jgi:hypothetical protein
VAAWAEHVEREERRYRDGLERLPDEADARQKQLVRVANAAIGAGLAELMDGRSIEARDWFARAAERYRESFDGAPAGSWGRLIGAVKARLLGGDPAGAEADAGWSLEQGPATAESPIGRYAAALAALVLGRDEEAGRLARGLQDEADRFPTEVADALLGLAQRHQQTYANGLDRTLRSFEERDSYLEDVPVADTVLVLERLAADRGMALHPRSALLPEENEP